MRDIASNVLKCLKWWNLKQKNDVEISIETISIALACLSILFCNCRSENMKKLERETLKNIEQLK